MLHPSKNQCGRRDSFIEGEQQHKFHPDSFLVLVNLPRYTLAVGADDDKFPVLQPSLDIC